MLLQIQNTKIKILQNKGEKMKKMIVITGGPCAGKSTIIDRLKQDFNAYYFIPEVATMLLESKAYPMPDPWTQEWQDGFQEKIVTTQLLLEKTTLSLSENKFIILDRGVLDGAAYMEGGVKEFCNRFNLIEKEVLNRYHSVIHLESLSTMSPKMYEELLKTNEQRFETLEQAQHRERMTQEVWKNHPKRYHVSNEIEMSYKTICSLIPNLFFCQALY